MDVIDYLLEGMAILLVIALIAMLIALIGIALTESPKLTLAVGGLTVSSCVLAVILGYLKNHLPEQAAKWK